MPEPTEPDLDLTTEEVVDLSDPIGRFDAEVRDALSVIVGSTRMLRDRFDELPPDRQLAMIDAIGRRAEELQRSLLPVLHRITAARIRP